MKSNSWARYWNLLFALVLRDFQVRYAQSVLGWAWAVLQPLSLMLMFSFLQRFLHLQSEGVPYPVFVLAALLPWSFFSTAVSQASMSLVSNPNLIKKVLLPRALFPLSSVVTALMDFLIALLLLFVLLVYYHQPLHAKLFALPLVLLPTFLFALILGLLTSAITVFVRDLRFALPFILQLLMYVSPVLYSTKSVPEAYRRIFALNPLTATIESFRAIILRQEWPDPGPLLIASCALVLVLTVTNLAFTRAGAAFADIV